MVNFIIRKMPIEIISHLKNSDAKHTIEAVKSKPYVVLVGINNDITYGR